MIKQTEQTITFQGYELQNLRAILHNVVYNSMIDEVTRGYALAFLDEMRKKHIGEDKKEE